MESKTQFPDPSQVREELIEKYPAKVAKKRNKSIIINDPYLPSTDGLINIRFFSYDSLLYSLQSG